MEMGWFSVSKLNLIFLFLCLFSRLISQLLRQVEVSPLIETFQNVQTLFLFNSSHNRKLVGIQHRATASESLVELPEIYFFNTNQVQCKGAHNTGLDGNEERHLRNVKLFLSQVVKTVNFTMSAGIFIFVGKVMA